MGFSKWIGGILGFMAMGPLGALAGIFLGSIFESESTSGGEFGSSPYMGNSREDDRYMGQRNSFLFSMLVMASYIIRADKKIMHSEMEYVRQFLRRNFGDMAVSQGEEILLKLFERQKQMDQTDPLGFKRTIQDCGAQIASNMEYEERLQLLAFLSEIAKSDGSICEAEIIALKEVAIAMGLSNKEIESILNLKGDTIEEAYKVLELDPSASNDEVRAAYRKLAIKHHPDKVANLGEDIRKAANEKFQLINAAKDRIYKARGLK